MANSIWIPLALSNIMCSHLLESGSLLLLLAHHFEQVLSLDFRGPGQWGGLLTVVWRGTRLPLCRPLVAPGRVMCRGRRSGRLRGGEAVNCVAAPTGRTRRASGSTRRASGRTRRTPHGSLPGGLFFLCGGEAALLLFVILLRLPECGSSGEEIFSIMIYCGIIRRTVALCILHVPPESNSDQRLFGEALHFAECREVEGGREAAVRREQHQNGLLLELQIPHVHDAHERAEVLHSHYVIDVLMNIWNFEMSRQ